MAVLKRIGVMSFAKLQAVVGLIVGLIYGIIVGLIFAPFAFLGGGQGALLAELGILSIVVFPVFFAFLGFVGGAVGAFLYNLVAGWIGGIEIEFEK